MSTATPHVILVSRDPLLFLVLDPFVIVRVQGHVEAEKKSAILVEFASGDSKQKSGIDVDDCIIDVQCPHVKMAHTIASMLAAHAGDVPVSGVVRSGTATASLSFSTPTATDGFLDAVADILSLPAEQLEPDSFPKPEAEGVHHAP